MAYEVYRILSAIFDKEDEKRWRCDTCGLETTKFPLFSHLLPDGTLCGTWGVVESSEGG
jgi:hypothetical protein